MSYQSKNQKGLQPKLRFPEFRDAGGWPEEKLEELYSFKSTNSLSRDKLTMEKGTVKNIHYGDIHTKFSTHFDIEKEDVPYIVDSESVEKAKPDSFCLEGDVIFADASEDMDDIGKSIEIVNLNNEKLLSGLHTILARQKKYILKVGFAGHLFQSPRLRAKIKKEAQGAKVLGISGGRLANIDVCFPTDKKEQQKIADCLSSLDALIEAEDQKLEALQKHKKGLMQDFFPATGETLPRRRFPEFRNAPEWGERTLENIANFRRGSFPQPYGLPEWYDSENGMPFVQVFDVSDNLRLKDKTKQKISKRAAEQSVFIPKGTLIVTLQGSIGRVAITQYDAYVDRTLLIFESFKEKLDQFFFAYVIQNIFEIEKKKAPGGIIKTITKEVLSSFKVAIPSLIEQKKIAENIACIDDLISAQSQKVDTLRKHKDGVIQQIFPTVGEVQE